MANGDGNAAGLPHLVDIKVLADHLGVAPRHVRRLVAEKRIPYVKWGHLVRFDPAEVAAWLKTARVPGNERSRPGASDSQTF